VPTDNFPGPARAKDAAANGGAIGSLNALVANRNPAGQGSQAAARKDDVDTEEDLFALPMSPRSPEMKRSPFSMLK
jgi:hypothetical protein